jgi:hypothetical protein
MIKIRVHESLIVNACPEIVWDVTQNVRYRQDWDVLVESAELVEYDPVPVVRLEYLGGTTLELRYKQFDRPRKTSLEIAGSDSKLIAGGGGSWVYEPVGCMTRWIQTNTLLIDDGWKTRPLSPMIYLALRYSTRRSMRRAKELAEKW